MNPLITVLLTVAVQLPPDSEQLPAPATVARYERTLAGFTPAEIQRSIILQDVQETVQSSILSREAEQQKLFKRLTKEEQEQLKNRLMKYQGDN